MIIYYIDTSVLQENIPLVKFIKTTSGTRWFIFNNLTREFIDDVIPVISLIQLSVISQDYCRQCLILLHCKFEPSNYFLANKNQLFYRCLFVYIIK